MFSDFYQPEAYVASSDTFIEKDSAINEHIDRLRHASTTSLLTRPDTIIVASVSCIYGLGSPEEYKKHNLILTEGMTIDQQDMIKRLVKLNYKRNDTAAKRGEFTVKGDTLTVQPANMETMLRIEMFGDDIEQITEVDALTREKIKTLNEAYITSASHYVTGEERLQYAIKKIETELQVTLASFEKQNKLLEAQRLKQRTEYDLEMLQEIGFVNGIENYSMHLDAREPKDTPSTLLDYFPDDFLIIMDESHVSVPQVRGMHAGDQSRKQTLVEHGFRLPSALSNRPLNEKEFYGKANQILYVSATPGQQERAVSENIAYQELRPTGLLDPSIDVRPTNGQIDDLQTEIKEVTKRGNKVLVTTLTKKLAEELTTYYTERGIKVHYLHSDVDTIERTKIINDLRDGTVDVLVGINLFREGLDIPETELVAILDADKAGFLRSETSLLQTAGRAARNSEGRVIMYGDKITPAMQTTIETTNKRRKAQAKYNKQHGISPKTIKKDIRNTIAELIKPHEKNEDRKAKQKELQKVKTTNLQNLSVSELEKLMEQAAEKLEFEEAAQIRDIIQKKEDS